jgi:hypothetical protein
MSGKYAVICRSLDCCWDNKEVTQNFPVSYASGIAGPGTNNGILYIDPKGKVQFTLLLLYLMLVMCYCAQFIS